MDLTKISSEICAYLTTCGLNFEESSVNDIVDKWYNAKKSLIDILSKHPAWSEKDLAIIFPLQLETTIDPKRIVALINKLIELINKATNTKNVKYKWKGSTMLFLDRMAKETWTSGSSVTKADLERLKNVFNTSLKEGKKFSRAINAEFNQLGIAQLFKDTNDEKAYNETLNELLDAFSDKKIPHVGTLSCHPIDYFNMSYGAGWTSCHSIPDGDWAAGTVGYMLDQSTLIMSGYPMLPNIGVDIAFRDTRKSFRQIIAFYHGKMLQSRLYPCSKNVEWMDQIRWKLHAIFATCFNVENVWKVVKTQWAVDQLIEQSKNYKNFPDYHYVIDFNITITKLVGVFDDEKIPISSGAHCLICNKPASHSGVLACAEHENIVNPTLN